eukprot:3941623-Rhodomonas_salina.3
MVLREDGWCEQVNEEWDDVDLCLVIGANDTVNCAAEDDPTCEIAGTLPSSLLERMSKARLRDVQDVRACGGRQGGR